MADRSQPQNANTRPQKGRVLKNKFVDRRACPELVERAARPRLPFLISCGTGTLACDL
jgi:hypothetical protein